MENNQTTAQPPENRDAANLTSPSDVSAVPADSPQASVLPHLETGKKKSKKGLKWVIVLLLVLALAGAGYWWYSNRNSESKTPVASTKQVDVDKITYGLTEGPVNAIYPESDILAVPVQVNMQLFEGLVAYKDQTKIVPLLAESWTNPDEKTWVFKLRRDVKFHNGNTLKAKHVKGSIEEIIKDPEYETFTATFLSSIDKIEVVDDYTVKLTTQYPDPVLLNKLTNAFIYDTDAKTRKDATNGTGAYVVKSGTKPTENTMALTAFEGYRDPVHVKEVEYKVYKSDDTGQTGAQALDQQILSDLENGELNIAAINTPQYIQKAESNPKLQAVSAGSAISHLLYNTTEKTSPFSNKKIRQAMVEALDLDAVLKATATSAQRVPASQFVTQAIPGYNADIKRPAYNPEHAKVLIKEAGNTGVAKVSCVFSSQTKDFANEMKRQYKLANIDFQIEIEDDDDVFFEKLFTNDYDCAYLSYSPDTLDSLEVFTTTFQGPWYQSDELDKNVEKIKNTFNTTERLKVMQDTAKSLSDDYPWLPMFTRLYYWGADKDLNINFERPGGELLLSFKNVTKTVPTQ